jgi:predicted dehydrogenase
MTTQPLRVGLLGAGAMGREHAYCYSQMAGVAVATVFSRAAEAAAEAAAMVGAEPTTDAASVIGDATLDAIDVCLPTPVHAEVVLAALEAGKHVFCETPLTLSLAEGERMREAARRSGRLLQVGLLMRSIAACRLVRQAVESGEHGALVSITAHRLGSYLRAAAADHKPHYSDPTTELMTFDFDFVGWVMGPPRSVLAVGADFGGSLGEVTAVLAFEGGRSATILASGAMPASFPFTTGFRATFERAAIDTQTVIAGESFSGHTRLFGAGGEVPLEVAGANPYQVELEHFLACIRGEADPDLLDVERALEALRLSLATQASLRLGEPVEVARQPTPLLDPARSPT